MRFSAAAAVLLSVGAAVAQTTHVVQVGGNSSLSYTPSSLTGVANGDIIQFQFLEKNHTVTQSTFASPCSNVTSATGAVTGVDSGFQFVNTSATQFPVWQITINNASAPLWFYCRQAKHCQAGMVFAVNPTAAKSFDAFKTAAAASTAVNGSPSSANTTTGSTGSSASAASSAGSAAGTAAVGTGSAATTPSPSVTAAAGNGAASMTFSGATILSLVGLSLGLLL
ncbi:hypothetical protein GSI_14180 [Ganoderma sinense ZZ0214-1]|uniref:Phytocyanin domain-containing protein n=1 Tax=Ganoderma sinense ZZ0214-1 TaxID=1077348 RepID=A0A2G8RSD5_9APHY|nr:hypothetical protein GSI_14180 [Ganoderma sinense ZZ0214-1]